MTAYKRKDHFYQKAKEAGYKSRASYKLVELNNSHHLLRAGMKVIDLGAWPGGWMQVALQRLGGSGKVVGIDLVEIEGFEQPNVLCIAGDVRDEENLRRASAFAEGRFDLVLSDMSPKLSGIREVDQAASVGCAELAFWVCEQILRPGGNFVVKVFKGNDTEVFRKQILTRFDKLQRCQLQSSRKTSNEFYLVGLGFRPQGHAQTHSPNFP